MLTSAIMQMRIWDFSGQTTLFFSDDKSKFAKETQRQSEQEVSDRFM